MKAIKKGLALLCTAAMLLQVFVGLPLVSAEEAQAYVLAESIEVGKTYVIVADGQYALNNQSVTYNNQSTLGATAVTVSGTKLTTEVTSSMLWTVKAAEGAPTPKFDETQYFVFDQNNQYLTRTSGSSGTAPLALNASFDNTKWQQN